MSQLVDVFDKIFVAANLGVKLRPYDIMATSRTAGLIEVYLKQDACLRKARLSCASFDLGVNGTC